MNQDELYAILRKIVDIPGAVGAVCADRDGDVKSMIVPDVYERDIITGIVRDIMDLNANIRELGYPATEFHYRFQRTEIFIRSSPTSWLIVMASSAVNMTMLGISMKMALKKADAAIDALGSGYHHAASSHNGSWGPAVAYKKAEAPKDHNVFSAGGVALQTNTIPLPKQDLLRLRNELARHIGPPASLMLRRTLESMQQSLEHFDSSRVAELIMNLGDSIQNKQSREQFNQSASMIMSEWIVPSSEIAMATSGNAVMSHMTPPPVAAEPEPVAMSAEMTVFNVLLRNIIDNLNKMNQDTYRQCFNHIESTLKTLQLGDEVRKQFQYWCRCGGDMELTVDMDAAEMSQITHTFYVFLCEYVGPVAGDRILGRAIKAGEALDEAAFFSPRQLL